MRRKIKVPIERQFNGTEELLMIPLNNKILSNLYSKKSFISRCNDITCISSIQGGIQNG